MSQHSEVELEQMRTLGIKALKNFQNHTSQNGSLQTIHLIIEMAVESVRTDLKDDPKETINYRNVFTEKEHDRAREIISNFIAEGILMWGLNQDNPNAPFLGITEYGQKVLEHEEIIPHDPNGFLTKFKSDIPNSNDLVVNYLTECLRAYRYNCLLSSSVMLGVASEAAFYDLFNQLKKTLTDQKKQSKFEKLEKGISIKEKFDETMKEITNLKKLLPDKMSQDVSSHVEGIFELIRNQRNDSGHPTGKNVSREDIFINLRLFIVYCKSVYDLVSWLNQNPLWEGQLK